MKFQIHIIGWTDTIQKLHIMLPQDPTLFLLDHLKTTLTILSQNGAKRTGRTIGLDLENTMQQKVMNNFEDGEVIATRGEAGEVGEGKEEEREILVKGDSTEEGEEGPGVVGEEDVKVDGHGEEKVKVDGEEKLEVDGEEGYRLTSEVEDEAEATRIIHTAAESAATGISTHRCCRTPGRSSDLPARARRASNCRKVETVRQTIRKHPTRTRQ